MKERFPISQWFPSCQIKQMHGCQKHHQTFQMAIKSGYFECNANTNVTNVIALIKVLYLCMAVSVMKDQ